LFPLKVGDVGPTEFSHRRDVCLLRNAMCGPHLQLSKIDEHYMISVMSDFSPTENARNLTAWAHVFSSLYFPLAKQPLSWIVPAEGEKQWRGYHVKYNQNLKICTQPHAHPRKGTCNTLLNRKKKSLRCSQLNLEELSSLFEIR